MFDTKIAIIVRDDLAQWQKLNVTAFLMSGITAANADLIALRTSPPVICFILASARASPASVSLTEINLADTRSSKSSPIEELPFATRV